ncbi:Leukemia inhibitory factor receptor [Chelonia mydas]|uniref:Leukemia inhibitory factor receptor n=1 Tax=Chelonia mydas TaxID=8469 RepID=M7AZU1_CHEMY|nr:Leukemia inhibitory factor receptor [Chelonia mydas]
MEDGLKPKRKHQLCPLMGMNILSASTSSPQKVMRKAKKAGTQSYFVAFDKNTVWSDEPFSPVCTETGGKRADIPVAMGSTNIQITTLNASGTPLATETFVLPEENVSLIPLTPQILNLNADFSTYTLYLKWNDSGSVFQHELDASWQIQILRKETMETVTLGRHEVFKSWFEDFSNSARGYASVTEVGKDTNLSSAVVFPQDKVVLVGSNVTFCCLYNEGESIKSMQYGSKSYSLLHLSKRSSAIQVQNVSASIPSGTNVWCSLPPDNAAGTVLFVGYAPDTPQNLNCETSTFITITCSWNPGRPTGLYSQRQTKYILFEREHITLMLSVRHWLSVCFQMPFKILALLYKNLDNVGLGYGMDNFSPCVAQRHLRSAERNVSVAGAENSNYRARVDALHPYATYTFRVRCSASEHFWRWSKWSEEKKLTTLEAPPARGPDIWRERSPVRETLTVFWKPLLLSEANGIILSHEVSCYLRETMLEVPVPLNSTEIKLEGNDCLISVVAKNRAGSSPPSRITSVDLPSDNVKTELAIAMGNGIYISWHSDPNVTCGYTLKWCISSGSEPCSVDWEMFPSNATDAVIKSAPKVAPNFTVEETSSESILVKWEDIPVEDCQGFLKGYILYFAKGEKGTSKTNFMKEGSPELTVKNITDLTKKSLRILDLQGKTSYRLDLRAYTVGGIGPSKDLYVVTKENSVGLIIAILIPVAVAVVLGVVTSILCYQKREWIKETFYPDIPNPENSKALQFQKNICEGNTALKTLEMNPCTPNSVEVVETRSTVLKTEDTEIVSPVVDSELPEDGSDPETGSHVVVSYCPPIIEEEISSPLIDEPVGSSQLIYIDIQSMYQPQINPEEEPEINFVTTAGYKPQMQLPINSMKMESHSPTEEDLDKTAGYRPQANTNVWKLDSPDSPISIQSNNENGSFGSPCSINSRQFLIPPKDYEDSPTPNNTGWAFTNFFQNKLND